MTEQTRFDNLKKEISDLIAVREGVQALLTDCKKDLADLKATRVYSEGEATYKIIRTTLLATMIEDLEKLLLGGKINEEDNRRADKRSSRDGCI